MPPPREPLEIGLIDALLILRNAPDPDVLLQGEAALNGWRRGVDASLDRLVPALKAISMMEVAGSSASVHGIHCIQKPAIEKVIGRVPLERTKKGWQ